MELADVSVVLADVSVELADSRRLGGRLLGLLDGRLRLGDRLGGDAFEPVGAEGQTLGRL